MSRRTAQKVSSGSPGSPTPRSAATMDDDARPIGLGLVEERGEGSDDRVVGRVVLGDAASLIAAAIGANVAPPDGSHRTSTTRARSRPRAASSLARRVLPTPGDPTIDARLVRLSFSDVSSSASRRSRSLARPTNGDVTTTSGRPSSETRWNALTGSALPFSVRGGSARSCAPRRTRRKVVSPTSTSPGPAASCQPRGHVHHVADHVVVVARRPPPRRC